MSYLTLREASEATGLNQATIRRLCKKPESKPYIELKKGKKGSMYTVQANYLFDVYPPLKQDKGRVYTRVDNDLTRVDKEPIQDYTALVAAKDEIIELLKSETAYLRTENTSLREENRELKLLSAPIEDNQQQRADGQYRSFWQRLLGK